MLAARVQSALARSQRVARRLLKKILQLIKDQLYKVIPEGRCRLCRRQGLGHGFLGLGIVSRCHQKLGHRQPNPGCDVTRTGVQSSVVSANTAPGQSLGALAGGANAAVAETLRVRFGRGCWPIFRQTVRLGKPRRCFPEAQKASRPGKTFPRPVSGGLGRRAEGRHGRNAPCVFWSRVLADFSADRDAEISAGFALECTLLVNMVPGVIIILPAGTVTYVLQARCSRPTRAEGKGQ